MVDDWIRDGETMDSAGDGLWSDMDRPVKPTRLNNIGDENIINALAGSDRFLTKFWGTMRILPHVNEDGSSECGFAEELYAQKEEAQQKLPLGLSMLRRCLARINQAIQVLRKERDIVGSDREELNGESAKESYTEAAQSIDMEIHRYVGFRLRVLEQMGYLEHAIEEGAKKRYPGDKPPKERKFAPPVPPITFPPPSPATPPEAGIDNREAENLFQLDTQRRMAEIPGPVPGAPGPMFGSSFRLGGYP